MTGAATNRVLARLIEQGAGGGAGEHADRATLRAIAEEAGELGATRALARLGLSDADAVADVAQLRELLAAWRDAKRSAWRALWAWIARVMAAALLLGLAVKLGLAEMVR
ncbi:hypothetical protein ASG29_00430 [Sphingomonas sp. Leaf412]|uniref:DUF6127 family protein n=1 Tax=Sphingomonas sp. Leaf412 TaxID=1736370 RepID=UPI0006F306D3|nr:DUF6127 family protein [Sphingomonas sp. Leaf412]KQT35354.1 hypothetical protein ASG29_00430 [Sphingomonas sp. Leaf412]